MGYLVFLMGCVGVGEVLNIYDFIWEMTVFTEELGRGVGKSQRAHG